MTSRMAAAVVAALVIAAGCSRHVDIEKVPVGSNVQLTRDDGGVVEGTLASRDAEVVTRASPATDEQGRAASWPGPSPAVPSTRIWRSGRRRARPRRCCG